MSQHPHSMGGTPSTVPAADAVRHPFRPRALERYQEHRDRTVLPRFASGHTFAVLWLLLALLALATVAAWFARVPVYAGGPVIVVEPAGDGGQPELVALLPAGLLPRLQEGSTMFVDLAGGGTRTRSAITAVDPTPQSPAAVRRRFALDVETARVVSGPVAVVTLDPAALPSGLSLAQHAGVVYRTELQIGSRRVVTLVPVLGRLFDE